MRPGDLTLRQRALLGAIGTVVVVGLMAIAVHAATGAFDGGYEVVGTFDRAGQGLVEGADVKLRGVTVGDVRSIELTEDGRAVVRLRIDDGVRVPDTTAAAIAPISVFGPTYVQLQPGDHEVDGPFLGDGDELAATTSPVEFNEVLADAERLLAAADPAELATIVSELADGLRGTGADLAALVDDGGELVAIADRHRADTERFLTDLGDLGEALGDHGDEIAGGMADLGEALEPMAAEPDRLAAVLDDTRRVAEELDTLIGDHAEGIGAGITAGARATEVIVAHLPDVPGYLASLARYFDVLGRSITVPGPGGAVLATQKFFLPDDLCLLLVCPAGVDQVPLPVPTAPPAGTPPAPVPGSPVPIVEVPPIPIPSQGPR
jgi:phospholipid/cholesterol/gamma-HCH transport system substrate-binding protein